MRVNPKIHHRNSIRLKSYDYASGGAYFVTVCSKKKEELFGEIENKEMKLNGAGQIVKEELKRTAVAYPSIAVDEIAIMPNHVHGIIWLSAVGAQFIAPGSFRAPGFLRAPGRSESDGEGVINRDGVINHAPTLGQIIRTFKASAAYRIHKAGISYFAWQRNYYERIIRNEAELNAIRKYIAENPQHWDTDAENEISSRPFPSEIIVGA